MTICECGELVEEGVCKNCGLEVDGYVEFGDDLYLHDPDRKTHYGDPRGNAIHDMRVMTRVDYKKTPDFNLRRILKQDGYLGWNVQSSVILNNRMKQTIRLLKLDKHFLDRCYFWLRKIRGVNMQIKFVGHSLENIGDALVYFFGRLEGINITLFDFKLLGFNTNEIFKNYVQMVKKTGLYHLIQPQDPTSFVEKVYDYIYHTANHEYRERFILLKLVKDIFIGVFKTRDNKYQDLYHVGVSMIGAIMYSLLKKIPEYKITQKEIADACGISEVTLREKIAKIRQYYIL